MWRKRNPYILTFSFGENENGAVIMEVSQEIKHRTTV